MELENPLFMLKGVMAFPLKSSEGSVIRCLPTTCGKVYLAGGNCSGWQAVLSVVNDTCYMRWFLTPGYQLQTYYSNIACSTGYLAVIPQLL